MKVHHDFFLKQNLDLEKSVNCQLEYEKCHLTYTKIVNDIKIYTIKAEVQNSRNYMRRQKQANLSLLVEVQVKL